MNGLINGLIGGTINGRIDALVSLLNYPVVLKDGNTKGWYDSLDATTITKDGSNLVSRWNDKLASGRDLIQATGTKQPLLRTSGLLFDGTDDFLKTSAFTLAQPVTIYLAVRQKAWVSNDAIFDGNANNTAKLMQYYGAKGNLNLYAGAYACEAGENRNGVWQVINVVLSGGSSFIQIYGGAKATGNPGTANIGGFTLAAYGGGIATSNIEVNSLLVRTGIDSDTNREKINKYILDTFFDGQTILIGDSITANYSTAAYPASMQDRWSGKPFYPRNYSVSGAYITPHSGYSDFAQQVTQSASLQNVKRIIVLLGANERIATIDTVGTVYAAQLNQLKANHPTAQIYCLGILPNTNAPADRAAINPVIKAAAQSVSGVIWYDTDTWINTTTDLTDGLHPSTAGHYKIATELLTRLNV